MKKRSISSDLYVVARGRGPALRPRRRQQHRHQALYRVLQPLLTTLGFLAHRSMNLKNKLRDLSAEFLAKAGVINTIANRRLRRRAIILMYHRVLNSDQYDGSNSTHAICVKTTTFESHIRFLKSNFRLLTLDQFLLHLEHHLPFKNRSCLITFDDGWLDNYQNAFPILIKYQVPATIFLTVGFIGTNKSFWQENLKCVFKKSIAIDTDALNFIKALSARKNITPMPSDSVQSYHSWIEAFIHTLKNKPQFLINDLISEITNRYELSEGCNNNRSFMNWTEIINSCSDNIQFGSHGITHSILTVDNDTAENEIFHSKRIIEHKLHLPIKVFSYPNGNFSPETVNLVKQSGYWAAFSTMPGFVDDKSDPFRLYRYNIHEFISKTPAHLMFHIMVR